MSRSTASTSGSATTTTPSGSCASATRSWTGTGPPRPARSAAGATPSSRPVRSGSSTGTPAAGRHGWRGSRPTGSCPASRTRTGAPPRSPSCWSGARCCSATSTPRSSPAGRGRRSLLSLSPSPPPAPASRSGRSPRRCWRSASSCCCWPGREGAGSPVPAARRRSTPRSLPCSPGSRPAVGTDAGARRLHDLVDLVRAVLAGMAADGLRGDRDAYDAINHLDFRDWLRGHGAQPSTLQSAIVRGQYDLVFSHEQGDPARPRFAAGWGVFLSSKLWFHYKGRDLLEAAGRAWARPSSRRSTRRWSREACGSGSSPRSGSWCRRRTAPTSGRSWSAGEPRSPQGWAGTSRW